MLEVGPDTPKDVDITKVSVINSTKCLIDPKGHLNRIKGMLNVFISR